jgi:D-xylose transport system substrate-binding protein
MGSQRSFEDGKLLVRLEASKTLGGLHQTGSTLMQEGYHVVLDPLVTKGDIKIVMDQFTPAWKTEPAQANAENALTANDNKVDAFLVSYDGMSLGVLQLS